MTYSLGAKRCPPARVRSSSAASRRSRSSTYSGTIEPPNTRAKASSTVDSSLRSNRSTRPISPPTSVHARAATRRVSRHCAVSPAWYRSGVPRRHWHNSENRVAAGQGGDLDPVRACVRAGSGLCSGVVCVIGCRGCSGEWRNGRRAGFRCQCPSGRGGSSPPSPTDRQIQM